MQDAARDKEGGVTEDPERGPTRAKRAAPSQASSHAAMMPAKSGAERVFVTVFAEMGGGHGGIKRSDGRWNPAYGQAPRLLAMHERSEVWIRGLPELPCDNSIRQESCKSHPWRACKGPRSRT